MSVIKINKVGSWLRIIVPLEAKDCVLAQHIVVVHAIIVKQLQLVTNVSNVLKYNRVPNGLRLYPV